MSDRLHQEPAPAPKLEHRRARGLAPVAVVVADIVAGLARQIVARGNDDASEKGGRP